jgi:hypothetical protein
MIFPSSLIHVNFHKVVPRFVQGVTPAVISSSRSCHSFIRSSCHLNSLSTHIHLQEFAIIAPAKASLLLSLVELLRSCSNHQHEIFILELLHLFDCLNFIHGFLIIAHYPTNLTRAEPH